MIDPQALRRAFQELYGRDARLFRAPGRVNLIGEHTDYNEGFVLPMAIEHETMVAAARRADRRICVRSLNQNETLEFDLNEPGQGKRGIWLDYIEGVARVLEERGWQLRGADVVLRSDVPEGSGLSSSAALEISVGLALVLISGTEIDPVELALVGQQAEHVYVGTKCGIMDQFIAALARRDHALLIDCRALEARSVPLNLENVAVVICDTGVKHKLAFSAYNERRAECEQGVRLLRAALPGIRALRDLSVSDFRQHEERLPEPLRSRCRHVVTENARTLSAAEALRAGDLAEMGRLMHESHRSLRDDYEVSCLELDLLVASARKVACVRGARMTGGGFGCCTVNLVDRQGFAEFQEVVAGDYKKAVGKEPAIYVSGAGEGAQEVVIKK